MAVTVPWHPMTKTDPGKGFVVVCGGKKCVRACEHDALVRGLCKVANVQVVGCQKICHGSVVGALLDGGLEWFERVETPRQCVDLKKAVARGSRKGLGSSLKKRRLKGLAGRPPRSR